jgi:hypothetical protein
MGQTRVGVIWNRIIDPDAESSDLGDGESGPGRLCRFPRPGEHAFLVEDRQRTADLSIAGAGVQPSRPRAVNGQNYNSPQIAAAALG